jgi:hypothetical protein
MPDVIFISVLSSGVGIAFVTMSSMIVTPLPMLVAR